MKNALKRTLFASLLGAGLAVGGAALAAMPASAAVPGLSSPGTTFSSDVEAAPGDTFTQTTTVGLFAYPVPTLTNTWFNVNYGPSVTPTAIKVLLNGADVSGQFSCDFTPSQYHYTRCNASSQSLPLAQGQNAFEVQTTYTVAPTATPGDTADLRGGFSFGDDAGNAFVPPVSGKTTLTVTASDMVDTPVIAPAIAAIALLGAGGVGGGVALSRRKKAKAHA